MSKEVDLEQAVMAARQHYAVLPYHGWQHALDVMADVDALLNRVESKELKAARKALIIAAAWHDVDYWRDHEALGFPSKEALSAAHAQQYLQTVRADDETIDTVGRTILATEHGALRSTDEERLLHAADIRNIGWLSSNSCEATIHLWEEEEILLGARRPWEQWQQRSAGFIDFTINEARQELPQLGLTIGGLMSFDTLAKRNRADLMNLAEPQRQ
jgi:hypothetical protein